MDAAIAPHQEEVIATQPAKSSGKNGATERNYFRVVFSMVRGRCPSPILWPKPFYSARFLSLPVVILQCASACILHQYTAAESVYKV